MNTKRILPPKYIKKANMWLVSIFSKNNVTNKEDQKMNWLSSKEEADKFYAENNIN